MSPQLLALVLAVSGCAGSVQAVGPDALADANRQWAGRTVTVVLADGTTRPAAALRVEPDSAFWVDPATGGLRSVATAEVATVERRDRARSTLRTAGAGALAGALVGAVSGGLLCPRFGCSAGDVAGLVVPPAIGGTAWGALGGALADRPDRFVFAPSPSR